MPPIPYAILRLKRRHETFADENVDGPIVELLRKDGHHVAYAAEVDSGITDDEIMQAANDRGQRLWRDGFSAQTLTLQRSSIDTLGRLNLDAKSGNRQQIFSPAPA